MKTITMRDITEVFLNRTGIDFARDKEMRGKILFGADLGIKPRELLQVYMDLKNGWDLRFSEDDLIDKQFSTFNGVIKLVFIRRIRSSADGRRMRTVLFVSLLDLRCAVM